MRTIPRHRRPAMRPAAAFMLAIALGNGCTSFQAVPLEDIKAKPDDFTGKKLRVHSLSMVSDSLNQSVTNPFEFTLHVSELQFPIASGTTVAEPMMFSKMASSETVQIDLQQTWMVEREEFDSGRTALFFLGALAVAGLVYGFYQAMEKAASDWVVGVVRGD